MESGSELAANYISDILKDGEVKSLKILLKTIRGDYENSCDYLQRHCKTVYELQNFLKEYPYLYTVDCDNVTLHNEELERGQKNADKFFVDKLKEFKRPVGCLELRECVDKAPADVALFIKKFYPNTDNFKRFLHKRPNIFFLSGSTVHLIEKVSVDYFKQNIKESGGEKIHFNSLRGRIGQAPEHIQKYINAIYPGNEFLNHLGNNSDVFRVSKNGMVCLVK